MSDEDFIVFIIAALEEMLGANSVCFTRISRADQNIFAIGESARYSISTTAKADKT